MNKIDLVVFDLAGTTIRDADHVSAAFTAANKSLIDQIVSSFQLTAPSS